MTQIKTVAVAGGTGEVGAPVVAALLAAGFPLTILSRTKGKLPATVTAKAKEVVVDYDSPASLESALAGIDALVVTLGSQTEKQQTALWLAAEKAGVSRYMPSEFGSDLDNPVAKVLPIFAGKVGLNDFIKERVASGKTNLTYTNLRNGAFLDWGMEKSFLIDVTGYKAYLYDGGDYPFSVTRLSTVGQAVVGVLRHPDETKNRAVYVHDGRITGKQLLEWTKAASPSKEWTVSEVSTEEGVKKSLAALSQGQTDMWVWIGFLHRAVKSKPAGAGFETTDNELLGIKTLSEAELKKEVQDIAKAIHSSTS